MSTDFLSQPPKLQNFETAFTTNSGGCRRTCHCGKTYYNPYGGWDWHEGELEALDKDPNAFSVDYSVGEVVFDGREYANACACWHEQAEKYMGWLDNYAHQIAEYFKLEKERKQTEADKSPIIPL